MSDFRRRLMSGAGPGGPKRYTITVYPSSLDTTLSVYDSIDSAHPIENAFTASSSSTYARVYWVYGNNEHTWIYLNFDLSQIPLDATIISVSGTVRQIMTGYQSTRWLVREGALTSGTTIKSSIWTPSSNSAFTITDAGTWTAAELRDAKWMTHIQRRNYGTTEYHCDLYGLSLTVTYEI